MNIFNKAALQNLIKSPARTLVTIIGVMLSTAMITGVATFGTSLLHFLIEGAIAKYGNWHVEFLGVDPSFEEAVAADKEVAGAVSYEEIGYGILEGGKSPEKPYLFVAGFDDEAFDALPVSLISGRLPINSGEVLLPNHVAIKSGVRYRVGDTISLAVGKRMDGERILNQNVPYQSGEKPGENKEILVPETEKTYTVVGICERTGFEDHSAPGYTLITRSDPGERTTSRTVFVTLENPRLVRNYAEKKAGPEGYLLNDYLLRFMGVSENKLFNTLLFSICGILTAIIMVGSIFLIYNAFHISINERTRQFGVLMSVGATAKQLRSSVVFEGLCVAAVGVPLGVLAGIGSTALVIPVVKSNFGSVFTDVVPLTLSVSIPAIAAASAVSLVTILISAYIPAKKAAGTPVMECIRQTNVVKLEAKAVKTSKLAWRLYGLEGTLALKNFKRNKKRYRSVVLSLVLSVVLFVSGNAFGTTLKRLSKETIVEIDYDILVTARGLDEEERMPLCEKLKTVDGITESLSQSVYQYVCAVSEASLSERYREVMGSVKENEKDDVGEASAGNSGDAASAVTAGGTVQLPIYLQLMDDDTYWNFLEEMGLPAEEYTGEDGKVAAFARKKLKNQGGAATEVFDVFAENTVTMEICPESEESGAEGARGLAAGEAVKGQQWNPLVATIVDTYPVDLPPMEHLDPDTLVILLMAPYSAKERFVSLDAEAYVSVGFFSEDPLKSVGEMEQIMQAEAVTSEYQIYSVYALMDQFRSLTFVIDVFTYLFVIMISLIAAANVFNTISTNIKLRRRELAMLRSMGMSEKGFNKMMIFECAFYGMRTLMFGVPVAGILSWLIYKGLTGVEQVESLRYQFPWGSMAVSMVGVFLIVFFTTLYAVRKIKKENIIDALRDDMT